MDEEIINPFIQSTVETFETMLNMEIEFSEPYEKGKNNQAMDISAIIGFSGDILGNIALSFPKDFAKIVVSKLVGFEMEDINEIGDAISEIANIVAGNAKKYLFDYDISISLPNVIIGDSHTLSSNSHNSTYRVEFTYEDYKFLMEITYKKDK